MRSATTLILAVATGLFALSHDARAELLAYEGFDYTVGSSLSGLDGGFGWNGGWNLSNAAVIQTGSLAYSDGTTALPSTGNHVLVGSAGGTAAAARAMVSQLALTPGTYWMSFVGQRQLPHPDTPNNYARAAAFQTQYLGSATPEQFSVGKITTPTTGTVTQTWDVFSVQAAGSSASTGVDQAAQIMALMQVTIVGGTDVADDDTVNLWVNPSLDENDPLGTPDAVNSGIEDYLFNSIRLFTGGTDATGLYAQLAIDEIRIGTELKDALTGVIVLGDTNGNGTVGPEDLTPIRMNYRENVSFRSQGDLNGDGLVDFKDFRQFKTGLLGSGGSLSDFDLRFLSVPEPSTMLLVLLGLPAIASRSRRRRQLSPAM